MKRLLFAVGISIVAGFMFGQSAQAVSSGTKEFVSADNTFYAYVKANETVDVAFLKADQKEPFNTTQEDVTITLDGPGIAQQKCVAPKNVAVGQGCQFAAVVAPQTGIWRIQFSVPAPARAYPEVAPSIRWGGNLFSWQVTVKNGATEQKGRVWTSQYALRQPDNTLFNTDFEHYYVSEDGYIYRMLTRGYNGQISTLSADGIGVREGKKCEPIYRSTDTSDTKFSPAFGDCGSAYKLFFEQPAGELPAAAKNWEGKDEWLRPTVKRPTVSELHFSSDGSIDQQSGKISFYLRHFIGQYKVKIDVDNDGGFDGQNDVTLQQQMKQLSNGLQSVTFDGVDKTGQIIPPSQPIGVKIEITRVAEIHFVSADVEGRTGGIELTRLNGENAPTDRMCWNDTELATIAEPLMTKQTDGRDCPESKSGVHGWAYSGASWGNARYVDDWAFAAARLDGIAVIAYPQATNEVKDDNERNNMVAVIAVVAGAGLLGLVGTGIYIVRRRKAKTIVLPPLPPEHYYGPQQQPSQSQPPSSYPSSSSREDPNKRM